MEKYATTTRLFCCHIFLLGLLVRTAVGQTGTIKGSVFDDQSALVGATVFLENYKTIGANTDLNGEFIINKVPLGEQVLLVTYLGYETLSIPVTVIQGEITPLRVILKPKDIEGREVLISAQRRGQTQAINQQLASDKIANIISSDKIQELPDVNAAEAIGRLPGVALNRSGGEGQKVVIRGLEPKFSAITVNGVRLPSNSSTDRSVDLSLISPELLDAIEVFKSPLPDMDAEAIGGTVNLRIKKAPEAPRLTAKILGGYNDLSGEFRDYKGVLQGSRRFLNNKLGVIVQGSAERFNRSGDFLTNTWRSGRTDSMGLTEILGSSLRLQDREEIRRRYNGSLALDYQLATNHSISLFGVFSQTNRDQFRTTEVYNPSNPSIDYTGEGVESELTLTSFTLSGDHNFNWIKADWSVSSSQSRSSTPYNYIIRFSDTKNDFDVNLNQNAHPRNYFAAATPNLEESNLVGGEFTDNNAEENTYTALANFSIPINIGSGASLEFKFGGKYYSIDRERDFNVLSENFYYLGGEFTRNAANELGESSDQLAYLPTNGNLIGINSFLTADEGPPFINEAGDELFLNIDFDQDFVRSFYEAQRPILNNNRFAIVNRYSVNETITAGYAMLKLKVGTWLTVIPGFRYEYSDNEYQGGISTVNGRYGVNGDFIDTTTFQSYGEFLPHLHIKIKPADWFDIRASYAQTLARPDFLWVTPRTQINNTSLAINSGNPDLEYSKSINYDFHLSAYDPILGLLTLGVFYKDISNSFFPWTIILADQDIAERNGHPGFPGYELTSYTNLDEANVYGFEIDLQTNLNFLPKPFNGIVLSTNYARLFSETKAFFTTSETELISAVPPIFETTYTTEERTVDMISQSPHIFHLSIGYDINKFSARVSTIFQGTKASSYALDEDFDRFTLEFWRWDASIRQGIGENWSVFLNLNNISNQQDISFTRTRNFLNTVQTYGFTGTVGVQFQL
ncbi:MAG: TonB-dependent receptor [Bacteroidota bacterium]